MYTNVSHANQAGERVTPGRLQASAKHHEYALTCTLANHSLSIFEVLSLKKKNTEKREQ